MEIILQPRPASEMQGEAKPLNDAAATLKSGQIIKARVSQILAKGFWQLDMGSAKIPVKTQTPLKPGQLLTLRVEQGKGNVNGNVKLVILDNTNRATDAKLVLQLPPKAAQSPAHGARELQLSLKHEMQAQPRMSGQASTLAQGIKSTQSQNAAQTPPQMSTSPNPVIQAPARALQAAITQAVQSASTSQSSLSGIFAEAKLLLHSGEKPLPAPVLDALKDLLGLRLTARTNLTGTDIKQAFSRSGLFLENRLGSKMPDGHLIPADTKSALLKLQGALRNWIGEKTRPFSPPENKFHPPFRQALPQGQPPRPPVLEPGSALLEAGRVLLGEARGALSRLTLLQTASMSATGDSTAQRAGPVLPEWNFEIPLKLGEETAIAQFRIDAEEHGEGADSKRQWSVHVSLDVPETGPVHASVGLSGKTLRVSLWAMRDETLAAFKSRKSELIKSFEENGLEAESITFRQGAPKARMLKPGSMMDQIR